MSYPVFIFSRNKLKIVLVGIIIGGILQIICWKYLKNHPELVKGENSKEVTKPLKTTLRRFLSRGGAIFEVVGAKLVINLRAAIVHIAKKVT